MIKIKPKNPRKIIRKRESGIHIGERTQNQDQVI